jgi:hypothetical protein
MCLQKQLWQPQLQTFSQIVFMFCVEERSIKELKIYHFEIPCFCRMYNSDFVKKWLFWIWSKKVGEMLTQKQF